MNEQTYATLRAEWAILDEWKRLQRTGWCLAPLPVDEETGEVIKVADPEAQALVEAHALCAQVRAAVAVLPAVERRVVALRIVVVTTSATPPAFLRRRASWDGTLQPRRCWGLRLPRLRVETGHLRAGGRS